MNYFEYEKLRKKKLYRVIGAYFFGVSFIAAFLLLV